MVVLPDCGLIYSPNNEAILRREFWAGCGYVGGSTECEIQTQKRIKWSNEGNSGVTSRSELIIQSYPFSGLLKALSIRSRPII